VSNASSPKGGQFKKQPADYAQAEPQADARAYIIALPEGEQNEPRWQSAGRKLLEACETGDAEAATRQIEFACSWAGSWCCVLAALPYAFWAFAPGNNYRYHGAGAACCMRGGCVMASSRYAAQRARGTLWRLIDVILFGGVVLPLLVIGGFLLL
jgi:hypothetical protein